MKRIHPAFTSHQLYFLLFLINLAECHYNKPIKLDVSKKDPSGSTDCISRVLAPEQYNGQTKVTASHKNCVKSDDLLQNGSKPIRSATCRAGPSDPQPWCLVEDSYRQYDYCDIPICKGVGRIFITYNSDDLHYMTLNTPYLEHASDEALKNTLIIFKIRGIQGSLHLRTEMSQPFLKLDIGFDVKRKKIQLTGGKEYSVLETDNLPWQLSPMEWRGFRLEKMNGMISLRDEFDLYSILVYPIEEDLNFFTFSSESMTEWIVTYPTCYSLIGFGQNMLQPLHSKSGIFLDLQVTGSGKPRLELLTNTSSETYEIVVDREETLVSISHPQRNRATRVLMPQLSQIQDNDTLTLSVRYNKGFLVLVFPFDEQNVILFNSYLTDLNGLKLTSKGLGNNSWYLNCHPGSQSHCKRLASSNSRIIPLYQPEVVKESLDFYVAGNGEAAEVILSPWADLNPEGIFRIVLWNDIGIYFFLGGSVCKLIPHFDLFNNASWTHYVIEVYMNSSDKSYISLRQNGKELGQCYTDLILRTNFVSFFSHGKVVFTHEICKDCSFLPCNTEASFCNSTFEGSHCVCKYPYRGKLCRELINFCESNPCQNTGKCVSTVRGYECKCTPDRTGDNCEGLMPNCLNYPCVNGGTCRVRNTTVYCECKQGYIGDFCAEPASTCESNPCSNGGLCYMENKSPKCLCPPHTIGYTCGVIVMRKVERCKVPCHNNGVCYSNETAEYCHCLQGFRGATCQIHDSCNCQNNGTCIRLRQKSACMCKPYTHGKKCQYFRSCYKRPCPDNMLCVEVKSTYTCICKTGFYGERCAYCNATILCLKEELYCIANKTSFSCSAIPFTDLASGLEGAEGDYNKHWYIVMGCVGILTIVTILATTAFLVTRTHRLRSEYGCTETQKKRSDETQIMSSKKLNDARGSLDEVEHFKF